MELVDYDTFISELKHVGNELLSHVAVKTWDGAFRHRQITRVVAAIKIAF